MIGPSTLVIPGHGPVGDRNALLAFRDMLVGVRGRVAALKAQGKSLEEVQAAHPTADSMRNGASPSSAASSSPRSFIAASDTGSEGRIMTQPNSIVLAQRLLAAIGEGAPADAIATMFSEDAPFEIPGDDGVLPWIGHRTAVERSSTSSPAYGR